ncbi:tape measure protein [Rhodococcus erythropolis]|uniref:Hypothetical membrane protein n=2 Tax=Bacillati TaxID=1783272 RepID=C0ZXZ5_RHOE4|nr:tape measure protein [Rhodococcus erythropolis]BAH33230.1 hypothetical membrane protein [Rhodococcus erythropolis PR4]
MANNRINITISAKDEASDVVRAASDKISAATKAQAADAKAAADQFKSNFDFIGTAAKAAGVAIAGSAVGLTAFGLKSATELQVTAASFRALTGDAKVAKDLFANLYDFARGTPFAFPDVAAAGKTLLGYGRTAQQVKSDIQTLGGMVATTGADWSRLAVVYGQVNAAGKLYSQDALQLIENGVPIVTALAKQYGIGITDVKKKMEEGAVSADDFNKAMKSMVPADAISQMSNTMTGRLSGLTGSIRSLAFSLVGIDYSKFDEGSPLLVKQGGLFDRVTKAVQDFSKTLSDPQLKAAAVQLGDGLASAVENGGKALVDVLRWTANNLDIVKSAALAAAGAFVAFKLGSVVNDFSNLIIKGKTLSGVLNAMGWNPWIIGITAVVGAFIYLQDRFDIVGKAWQGTQDAARWAQKTYADFSATVQTTFTSAVALGRQAIDQFSSGLQRSRQWLRDHENAIRVTALVLTAVFGPALAKAAAASVVAGGSIAVSAVQAGAAWSLAAVQASAAWIARLPMVAIAAGVNAIKAADAALIASAAWIRQATAATTAWVVAHTKMAAAATAHAIKSAAQAVWAGHQWTFNGTRAAGSWILGFVGMQTAATAFGTASSAQAGMAAAANVAAAARTGIAWVAAHAAMLGIIGMVALAVGGLITMFFNAQSQNDATANAVARHRAAQEALTNATVAAKNAQDALNGSLLTQEGASLAVERAKRSLEQAIRDYGVGSLEAREATHSLRRAEEDLARASDDVAAKTRNAKAAQDERNKAAETVKATSHSVGGAVAGEAAQWSNLAGRINEAAEARNRGEFKSALPTMNAAPGLKNAIGTAYSPGGRTLVGEHGPEIVNMPRGSQVTQAYRTRNELNSGGDGGGVTNILSGNFTFNNQEASDAFFNRLDSTQRLAKVGM